MASSGCETTGGVKYARGAVSLYIVCDTTGSMSTYIESLRTTLPQFLATSRIFFGDAATIHIISYKDYCDSEIISTCSGTPKELEDFASKLIPDGGGDWPEAAKTALNKVIEMVDTEKKKAEAASSPLLPPQPVVFLYTDAPPHHELFDALDNYEKESKALENSPAGFDWIKICRAFRERSIPVYSFLPVDDEGLRIVQQGYYVYGFLGSIIALESRTQPDLITRATMGVQLALFGEKLEDTKDVRHFRLSSDVLSAVFGPPETSPLPDENSGLAKFADRNHLWQSPFEFPGVPGLADLLKGLPSRFVRDPAFRDVVFEVLGRMFTVENVLALTYNGIIGALWRLCCRCKDDERLPKLRDELSKCCQTLPESSRKTLQDWLEQSYDQTAEIEDEISEAEKLVSSGEKEGGVLVMEVSGGEWAPTRFDLMSIARSPLPLVLAGAQRLLTQVMVVGEKEKGEGVRYLPLALSDEKLFAMLPHLVCGGTMFTRRPAAIMAILAWLSGNECLKERAARFLGAIRGEWIPLDDIETFPEVMSAGFVRLMSSGVDEFLTERERELYTRARTIQRLRLAAPKELSVRVPFKPSKDEIWADDKRECAQCHHLRSFTLLKDGICGRCLSAEPDSPPPGPDSSKCSPTQSHLTQCTACTAIYALVQPDNLRCAPKCHYCRASNQPAQTVPNQPPPTVPNQTPPTVPNQDPPTVPDQPPPTVPNQPPPTVPNQPAPTVPNQPAPTVTCTLCRNKFVHPTSPPPPTDSFTCAVCRGPDPQKSISTLDVPLRKLVEENKQLLSLFGLSPPAADVLFSPNVGSLFKIYMQHRALFFSAPAALPSAEDASASCNKSLSELSWQGKVVHDVAQLLETVREEVLRGSLVDTCYLCFEDRALVNLESACGRCANKACGDCLGRWYGQARPGELVLRTHLSCAFCKRAPAVATLKRHNRVACMLVRSKKAGGGMEMIERADMYYAWCVKCYLLKELMPKDCASEQLPSVKGFVCEGCQEVTPEGFKQCPGCAAQTVKAGGCNHITCVCGAHWCYECSQGFGADDIYDHMYKAHGGLGIEGE